MRQMIKELLAAFAVMTAGAATPAMACGYGGCCGVVSPCAPVYAAPAYNYVYSSGCGHCDNSWAYDRLAEPTRQYYYVNQGPTYSGPGAFAPEPMYEQQALPVYGYRHHAWHHHHWANEGYYHGHPLVRRSY
jgi:hypothetical protein